MYRIGVNELHRGGAQQISWRDVERRREVYEVIDVGSAGAALDLGDCVVGHFPPVLLQPFG